MDSVDRESFVKQIIHHGKDTCRLFNAAAVDNYIPYASIAKLKLQIHIMTAF
jgi:hypothetical protein